MARFTRHPSAWNRADGLPPGGARPRTTRKARFYQLTKAGRKPLVKETTKWKRPGTAIGRILESPAAER
jgi:hypothetical protein